MPHIQMMAERANEKFNRANIDEINLELFAVGQDLVAAAVETGVAVESDEQDVLASFPDGQKEAVRAAVLSALSRSPRLPITFAWAPGYYFEVNISEVPGTSNNRGGMTIFMRSRFPDDPPPVAAD